MSLTTHVCKQFSQVTFQDWSIQGSKGKAWIVYLHGNPIDIVWFEEGSASQYVRESLIRQDGYNPDITVGKSN